MKSGTNSSWHVFHFVSVCSYPIISITTNSLLLIHFVIDHLRFIVMKDAFCIHHIGWLCCRMHVRCCMFVAIINLIGSNSSRFPLHQSPVGKPFLSEEDFLGKKWLRRTANGRPGTDAAVPICTSKRKKMYLSARHPSAIRTKAIPSGFRG